MKEEVQFNNSYILVFFLSFETGDLATSIRDRTDLHFGLYHSLKAWFHPLFEEDKRNKYQTSQYAQVWNLKGSGHYW